MNNAATLRLTIFSIAILTFSSCKQFTKSIDDTLHGRPVQNADDRFFASASHSSNANFLVDASALDKAEAQLKDLPELKGKSIKVFNDMHLYDDGRIMVQIQDPDTLQNVNEYDYSSNKEWGSKQPVKLSQTGIADVNSQVIPLDSVKFVTVAKMAGIYADSAKRYGSNSRINHIYYVTMAHRWYCSDIEGTRSNYQIYFNPDGSVKEFDKK